MSTERVLPADRAVVSQLVADLFRWGSTADDWSLGRECGRRVGRVECDDDTCDDPRRDVAARRCARAGDRRGLGHARFSGGSAGVESGQQAERAVAAANDEASARAALLTMFTNGAIGVEDGTGAPASEALVIVPS